jgi:hypothetical protein
MPTILQRSAIAAAAALALALPVAANAAPKVLCRVCRD